MCLPCNEVVSINLPCALVFHFYWLLFNLVKGNLFLLIELLSLLLLAGAKLPLETVFEGEEKKSNKQKPKTLVGLKARGFLCVPPLSLLLPAAAFVGSLLLLWAAPVSPGSKQVAPSLPCAGLWACFELTLEEPQLEGCSGHQSSTWLGWRCLWASLWCLGVSLSLAKYIAQVAGDKFKKKCLSEGTSFWIIIFRFVQCLSWAILNPSGVTATADWFFSGQPRPLKGSEEDLNSSSGLLPCAEGSKYW